MVEKKSKKKKKLEGGKKRVSQKKMSKFHQMWIEQILLKIDDINARLTELEKTVSFIKEKVKSITNSGESE